MNPYTIRLRLLEMAQDMLNAEYREQANVEREFGRVAPMYSTDEVIKKAAELQKFVDNKD